MKKLLVGILALVFFAACNNDATVTETSDTDIVVTTDTTEVVTETTVEVDTIGEK